MQKLEIKIINQSGHPLPQYATTGSSGVDLRAHLSSELSLKPLERKLIPTGLFIEMPIGVEAQIRPRSGLALKQGLTCLNTPGTIDADYRGEIGVILINLSDKIVTIADGDRIAQMVFQQIIGVHFKEVSFLEDSARGEGGLGHTGKK